MFVPICQKLFDVSPTMYHRLVLIPTISFVEQIESGKTFSFPHNIQTIQNSLCILAAFTKSRKESITLITSISFTKPHFSFPHAIPVTIKRFCISLHFETFHCHLYFTKYIITKIITKRNTKLVNNTFRARDLLVKSNKLNNNYLT